MMKSKQKADKFNITVNIARRGEDERSFDRDFWRSLGPEGILDAAFSMGEHYWAMMGKDPSELTFHRTITAVKRRGE